MRTMSRPLCLCIAGLAAVACLGQAGCRSGMSPQIKTIASTGDRPLPVVTGTPGEQVAAGESEPMPKTRAEARLSGRVLDAQGKPVANARVRLATTGATGGRIIRTTTDETGGFTLRGVRAGGSYTLIAEGDDPQGVITGRAQVHAPDTAVRIRLRDLEDAPATVTRPGTGGRVSPASNRGEIESGDDRAAGPRVNLEDLPPAPEADAFEQEAARPRKTRSMARLSAPVQGTHWKRGAGAASEEDEENDEPTEASRRGAAPVDGKDDAAIEPTASASRLMADETRPRREPRDEAAGDDDGQNPLPPALEPKPAPEPKAEPKPAPEPKPTPTPEPETKPEPEKPAAEPSAGSVASPAPGPSDPAPEAKPAADSNNAPASKPLEELPAASEPPGGAGAAAPAPEGPAPAPAAESSAESPAKPADDPGLDPPAPAPDAGASSPSSPSASTTDSPAAKSQLAARTDSRLAARPAASQGSWPESSSDGYDPFAPTADAVGEGIAGAPRAVKVAATRGGSTKRPSWGDLSRQGVKGTASNASAGSARALAVSTSAGRSRSLTGRLSSGKPYCRYDSRKRTLTDFRLPDLAGQPVRFQDLDADYVLLDFWGTWCRPCLQSVPHLVALQQQAGPAKLRVVSIAYEEGTTAERVARVSTAARELGINYTVLLGGLDGPCPLQTAFRVQSFPTMILVDRYGRVLWRDQGSSPETLTRLDRVLASAANGDFVRR